MRVETRNETVPLRIANIHLPSNRLLGAEKSAVRRIAEIEHVVDTDPAPQVLCGDFNEKPGGAVSACLSRRDFVDAADVAGKDSLPTAVGGGRGDYIWLHRSVADYMCEYAALGKIGRVNRRLRRSNSPY